MTVVPVILSGLFQVLRLLASVAPRSPTRLWRKDLYHCPTLQMGRLRLWDRKGLWEATQPGVRRQDWTLVDLSLGPCPSQLSQLLRPAPQRGLSLFPGSAWVPPSAPPTLCLPAHLHFADRVPGAALGISGMCIHLRFPAVTCTGRQRGSDRRGVAVEVWKLSAVLVLQPTDGM